MSGRETNTEHAVVTAFLRSGHPRLAFGTVVIRSVVKLSTCALVAGSAAVAGKDGLGWIAQVLPTLLR